MRVLVADHPLIAHKLTYLRKKDTDSPTFRRLADELLESHRTVRAGAGAARRGLSVTAQKPADILGVYVYLPIAGGAAGGVGAGGAA